ncbi:MAG: hydroxymethylbilane synthase [Ignavibacteria bacterium]|nr:hydroxymethylbilane synthase [Ignavibacteria bacterium]
MTKKPTIVIGSRGSQLALWQAEHVKSILRKKHRGLDVTIKIIKTKGDKILDVALSKIGDKGLFTKELENALLSNEIDIAVHSLKDLQTLIPEGLTLAAISERHPVEDALIARKKGMTLLDLPEGGTVATGSLRRRSQLLHLRPDLHIVELRGNVPTRIERFTESGWDGIILARAGVERLGLKKHISSIIPVSQILPAVGQGALGIETSAQNSRAIEIIQVLHHENTAIAVQAERALLKTLEGGCQIPIGAYGEVKSNGFYFSAVVGSIDGSLTFSQSVRTSKNNPEKTGITVAKALIKAGAGKILQEIHGS